MMNKTFYFKQFQVTHQYSTMKVGTDAVLLGAITDIGNSGNILEVGTGCGVIALMLAQRCKAFIHAIDIDAQSVEEANKNFEKSPWQERLLAEPIALQDFTAQTHFRFDLIISNPPFFTNSLKNPDRSKARARHNDNLSFKTLIAESAYLLNPHGKLALIAPASEEQNLLDIAKNNDLMPCRMVRILPREDKSPNRIVLEFEKHKTSKSITSGNISIRNPGGEYSPTYIALLKDFLLYF
ncbi:MAG: tRNA1(Val) (adenine(37)-N6)-methyltransferase [Bacteroidales bacterium]